MQALVVGGAGFIGSNLVDRLIKDGDADFAIPMAGATVTAGLAVLPVGKGMQYLGLNKAAQSFNIEMHILLTVGFKLAFKRKQYFFILRCFK